MSLRKILTRNLPLAATVALFAAGGAQAQSGLITKAVRLPPLKLASGQPLAEKPYELLTGKYYRLAVEADGSAELAIAGAEFFRDVWINEVVINDIEVRPLGLDSIEFDAAGKAEITFIPIRPGTFKLSIPGSSGETQSATFNVVDPMFATGATAGAAPAAAAEEPEEDDDDDAN